MRRIFLSVLSVLAWLAFVASAAAQPVFNNPPIPPGAASITIDQFNNTVINNPVTLSTNPLLEAIPNDTSTGTTIHKLAKISSAGKAILATTADTSAAIGVCNDASCGTSGNGNIAVVGQVSCVFDGATTAGDVVGVSTATNGDCTDLGAASSIPTGVQVLGFVYTTNVGAGTYILDLDPVGVASLLTQQNNKNNPCAGTPIADGTQSSGGTLTLDFSKSCSFTATFGAGNLSVITTSHLAAGDCGFLALKQDSSGSRTVTTWTNFLWAGGSAPTLSTGGSDSDLITFCSPDGSHLAAQLSVANYH